MAATCNSDENTAKRNAVAEKLLAHDDAGGYIVFYDETNYNVYCKRTQGRAKAGERAKATLPPSEGANLQLQCSVSVADGLLARRIERITIRMEQDAAYVDAVYAAAKEAPGYNDHFLGKKMVIVMDRAPAHRQTETRVSERDDLALLRLAPYSTMCNAIKNRFSVLKAKINAYLRLAVDELVA